MKSDLIEIQMENGCDRGEETLRNPAGTFLRFSGQPLLPLIADGDTTAVDRFVDRYGGLIWSIAKKMTRSSHDTEDLVQEVFIELWRNAASFQPDRGSEVSFIATIARRRVVDRLRKKSSILQVMTLDEQTWKVSTNSQRDSLEIDDELAKIHRCLGQLSSNTQEVLKLILQQGMSHQEVSSSMSLPLGSVKSYARRGLLFLRECVSRPLSEVMLEAQS